MNSQYCTALIKNVPEFCKVGSEVIMNLSKWKNMGHSSTKPGSRTVMFIKTLQMVTMAYLELVISNLELSSMNFGSSILTPTSCEKL